MNTPPPASSPDPVPPSAFAFRHRRGVILYLRRGVLEILLLGACVVLSSATPDFLSFENLLNVLRSVSETGIIAFGMTMVIIAGEIDLSVGSAVAFAGCLTAWLVTKGVPAPLAIAGALTTGGAIGSFIGIFRARFGVPSFITSLALLTALRGAALKMTGGFSLTPFPPWYNFLGSGHVLGVPFPAILFALTFLAVLFVMEFTVFGRSVYAVGGNAEAARLCGISLARVRILTLAATGVLAAWSGVMLSARILSGNPTVAAGWELDVISAVIIGGTSLGGGAGRVWGTLVGVVFIGVIVDGMRLLDIHEDGQLIARGIIVALAVLLSRVQQDTRGSS